jgi:hypothetical protein
MRAIFAFLGKRAWAKAEELSAGYVAALEAEASSGRGSRAG